MVTVGVFEFGVMRCQPLRRALASQRLESSKSKLLVLKNQLLVFKLHNFAFEFC
ncbi:acetyltransferase [Vibrio cholerae]|nr:acetyltransferase [Vibrio cholerae]